MWQDSSSQGVIFTAAALASPGDLLELPLLQVVLTHADIWEACVGIWALDQ